MNEMCVKFRKKMRCHPSITLLLDPEGRVLRLDELSPCKIILKR